MQASLHLHAALGLQGTLRREGSSRAIEPIIEKIKAEAIERQRRAGVPRPRSGACKRASGLPSLCPHSDQVSQRSEMTRWAMSRSEQCPAMISSRRHGARGDLSRRVSRLKGDFANKPFRRPVKPCFAT